MKNRSSTQGFTIIELIVVVVIIAILATIASFGFSSWRKRTEATVVKNDLIALKTAMKNEKNFGTGYPTSLPSTFKANPNVTVTYVSGDADSYCINAVSKVDSSVQYYIDSSSNSAPQSGGCVTAPSAPAPTVASKTYSSITVSWAAVAGAAAYAVVYGTTATPTTSAGCASSPCTISGLSASTTYYVKVTATNSAGSATSSNISATTDSASSTSACCPTPGPGTTCTTVVCPQ